MYDTWEWSTGNPESISSWYDSMSCLPTDIGPSESLWVKHEGWQVQHDMRPCMAALLTEITTTRHAYLRFSYLPKLTCVPLVQCEFLHPRGFFRFQTAMQVSATCHNVSLN